MTATRRGTVAGALLLSVLGTQHGCKKATEGAGVKTIEDLGSADGARADRCGIDGLSLEDALGARGNPASIDVTLLDAAARDGATGAVATALGAVPQVLRDVFFGSGGTIVVANGAASLCKTTLTAAERAFLGNVSASPDLRACWDLKSASPRLIFENDEVAIRDNVVRVFGYALTQLYLPYLKKLAAARDDGSGASVATAFSDYEERLATLGNTFLQDVAESKGGLSPKRVAMFRKNDPANFNTWVFVESLDSMFCRPGVTDLSFARLAPRTARVFLPFARVLGYEGSADSGALQLADTKKPSEKTPTATTVQNTATNNNAAPDTTGVQGATQASGVTGTTGTTTTTTGQTTTTAGSAGQQFGVSGQAQVFGGQVFTSGPMVIGGGGGGTDFIWTVEFGWNGPPPPPQLPPSDIPPGQKFGFENLLQVLAGGANGVFVDVQNDGFTVTTTVVQITTSSSMTFSSGMSVPVFVGADGKPLLTGPDGKPVLNGFGNPIPAGPGQIPLGPNGKPLEFPVGQPGGLQQFVIGPNGQIAPPPPGGFQPQTTTTTDPNTGTTTTIVMNGPLVIPPASQFVGFQTPGLPQNGAGVATIGPGVGVVPSPPGVAGIGGVNGAVPPIPPIPQNVNPVTIGNAPGSPLASQMAAELAFANQGAGKKP